MKWIYTSLGSHVHVRVFFNGAHCGNLCFRVEEFHKIMEDHDANGIVQFVPEHAEKLITLPPVACAPTSLFADAPFPGRKNS